MNLACNMVVLQQLAIYIPRTFFPYRLHTHCCDIESFNIGELAWFYACRKQTPVGMCANNLRLSTTVWPAIGKPNGRFYTDIDQLSIKGASQNRCHDPIPLIKEHNLFANANDALGFPRAGVAVLAVVSLI